MTRKASLQKILLHILREQEELSRTDLVPLAIQMLAEHDPDIELRRVHPKYVIHRTVKRMTDQGMITLEEIRGGNVTLRLTDDGRKKLRILRGFETSTPEPTPRWNGKWHMLILDLSENQKGVRDKLRTILSNAGFKQLKNSIWVHTCDCSLFVIKLRDTFGLQKEIIYVIADSIDTIN